MYRVLTLLLAVMILGGGIVTAQQLAGSPGNEHFQRTWERTDRPVLDGIVSRTWMWSPQAFTAVMREPYAESPGGMRDVQYFDKARMEITNPDGDSSSVWYVTNGLLVVEMVTGNMQIGDADFEQDSPAAVNVAGDRDDPTGPTYATFAGLLDAAPSPVGATITQRVDRDGDTTDDPALSAQGVTVAVIDDVTNHAIAAPFWEFMNSSGTVYQDGQFITDQLFENAYFPGGRPIAEPYWANVKVGGTNRDVLIQCFERRCMTYTPGNPDGFVVEAGNVGQHYYAWRYDGGNATPQPAPTSTPTPPPTSTPTATTPPPPPTNTPTPPPPPSNCHASYPDFCIPPPPPDLNCDDFWQTNFTVLHNVPNPDPHDLDRDSDGVGCES